MAPFRVEEAASWSVFTSLFFIASVAILWFISVMYDLNVHWFSRKDIIQKQARVDEFISWAEEAVVLAVLKLIFFIDSVVILWYIAVKCDLTEHLYRRNDARKQA